MSEVFGIIGKFPSPGFSKTRLEKALGAEKTERIHLAMLEDFFRRLGQNQAARKIYFFGTPAGKKTKEFFEKLASENQVQNFIYFDQPEFPFFERLQFVFKTIERLEGQQCFIHLTGTDIPDFPFENLLAPSDQVGVAPDDDGGFYYLGARAKKAAILEIDHLVKDGDMTVCEVLTKYGSSIGENMTLLPVWSDVDVLEDLVKLIARSDANELPAIHSCAKKIGLA